ncbi:hypothetical protein F0562_016104 [Nyssa sinensis]|uniref:Uncharacterized protein n=1 Tax=Nyssa sinensis TaxID=561372 RepID=A0A5J4ZIW9_9ASTE|nr:hypothetical protein F0562_016104 [Nyssa sinensis]
MRLEDGRTAQQLKTWIWQSELVSKAGNFYTLVLSWSAHLLFFWILFENVMSLHRTKATIIGLFEAGRVNEWVVTEKLGDTLKTTKAGTKTAAKRPRLRIGERLHLLELGIGAFLFYCGCYNIMFGKNNFFLYLYVQSIAFFIVGFGYVGTFVPTS